MENKIKTNAEAFEKLLTIDVSANLNIGQMAH